MVLPLGKKYSFPPEPRTASSRTRRNDHTDALRRRTSEKKDNKMGSFSIAWISKAFEVIVLSDGSLRYSATRSLMSFLYSGVEEAITTNQNPVGRVLALGLGKMAMRNIPQVQRS